MPCRQRPSRAMLAGGVHADGGAGMTTITDDDLDFALVVWREEGRWVVDQLPTRTAASLDLLRKAVHAQAGDEGAMAMVSIAEDFFVLVRAVRGRDTVLLSDATAAEDWPLAREVLREVGMETPVDDSDEVVLAGDSALLADYGVSSTEIVDLCNDVDLYPDEILATIATRLGFADQFDAVLEQIA